MRVRPVQVRVLPGPPVSFLVIYGDRSSRWVVNPVRPNCEVVASGSIPPVPILFLLAPSEPGLRTGGSGNEDCVGSGIWSWMEPEVVELALSG